MLRAQDIALSACEFWSDYARNAAAVQDLSARRGACTEWGEDPMGSAGRVQWEVREESREVREESRESRKSPGKSGKSPGKSGKSPGKSGKLCAKTNAGAPPGAACRRRPPRR
eukprot:gene15108-biopygen669